MHCDGQTTSGEIDRDEQIKGENRAGLSHQPVHQRQNGLREREPEYEPTGLTDPQLLERFGGLVLGAGSGEGSFIRRGGRAPIRVHGV